ncbi:MAG: hypothetical protein PWP31_1340 [Clostridia bacterium]|nr:hypothetical protein [Clostridia bacterium]
MTLDMAKEGQRYRIISLPETTSVRAQAIRFGIAEGAIVTCTTVIPGGPIVIAKNRQELAIGRGLAQKITIEAITTVPVNNNFMVRRRAYGLSRPRP